VALRTEAEPVIFFLLFFLLEPRSAAAPAPLAPGVGPAAWKLGLVSVLGVLFHQELIAVIPFSVAVLWLRPGSRRRWRVAAAYAVLVGAAIALLYGLAAHLATGARGPAGLIRWSPTTATSSRIARPDHPADARRHRARAGGSFLAAPR